MIKTRIALAALLVVFASALEPAAAASCNTAGAWRNLNKTQADMYVEAAAAEGQDWVQVLGDGETPLSLTTELQQVATKSVKFNKTDNGQRNELTVTFQRMVDGSAVETRTYLLTVQARERIDIVPNYEVKAKGVHAKGAACSRRFNEGGRAFWWTLVLGGQTE